MKMLRESTLTRGERRQYHFGHLARDRVQGEDAEFVNDVANFYSQLEADGKVTLLQQKCTIDGRAIWRYIAIGK